MKKFYVLLCLFFAGFLLQAQIQEVKGTLVVEQSLAFGEVSVSVKGADQVQLPILTAIISLNPTLGKTLVFPLWDRMSGKL